MTETGYQDPRELAEVDEFRPQVALPGRDVPVWIMVLIGAVVALGIFLMLESSRHARERQANGAGQALVLPGPPPPLVVPVPQPVPSDMPKPAASEQSKPTVADRPIVMTQPVYRPVQRPPANDVYAPPRYRTDTSPTVSAAPGAGVGAMVIDLTTGKGVAANGTDAGADAGEDAIHATVIRNRSGMVPQGVIIAAVLETPLNSDRPGMARALVANDVRGFDGSRVLIPRGSRLIGEFKADNSQGMRRILVNWIRLVRSDGVAIRIGSPSSDRLGGAGIPGSVNTHFFERFTAAVLQSALTVGVNVASQIPSNGNNVFLGLPGQATQLGQELLPDTKRSPTVKVRAGARIAIFVAHDLDFGGTPAVR